jgi:hypothetical protein
MQNPCSLLGVHKYTQVENPGEGLAQIFDWGVSKLSGKIIWGSPISALIAFLSRSSLKIACGEGCHCIPPLPPCASVCMFDKWKFMKVPINSPTNVGLFV